MVYKFTKDLRSRKSINSTHFDNAEADDEDELSQTLNTNKRQRRCKIKKSKKQKVPSGYEPDVELIVNSDVLATSSNVDYGSNEECWEVFDFSFTDKSDGE